MVSDWLGRRSCTKRELLSLVGTLQHAASVAKACRCFIRRRIDLSCRVNRLHYWVRLNADERADLLWWDTFLVQWTGTCSLRTLFSHPPTLQMSSYASGIWGCGAVWREHWLQWEWSIAWSDCTIAAKECVPVLSLASLGVVNGTASAFSYGATIPLLCPPCVTTPVTTSW